MKLTCVTATFNCIKAGNRERLIRCVESVAKLKTAHEHLVYDGASTDGTAELLHELEAKAPGLKVVSESDAGVYDALNKGLRVAQGEWFYVLGADDFIVHPEVLDDIFKSDIKASAIVSPVERDGGYSFFRSKKDLRVIFWGVPYSHQGLLVRTELMRQKGGFDMRYKICADWDFMLKMHESNVRFDYRQAPFAYYSSGGMSEIAGAGRKEVAAVLSEHLRLSEHEKRMLVERRVLPIAKMLPYMFHSDLAFRLGARYMILRRLLDLCGLIDSSGAPRLRKGLR